VELSNILALVIPIADNHFKIFDTEDTLDISRYKLGKIVGIVGIFIEVDVV